MMYAIIFVNGIIDTVQLADVATRRRGGPGVHRAINTRPFVLYVCISRSPLCNPSRPPRWWRSCRRFRAAFRWGSRHRPVQALPQTRDELLCESPLIEDILLPVQLL